MKERLFSFLTRLLVAVFSPMLIWATISVSYSQLGLASESDVFKPIELEQEIHRFFPEATVIGEPLDEAPIIPVYQLQELLGYVFQSNDFVNIPGFSGDRVNILIGMDVSGKLVGNRILDHHEPIFLHGLGDPPLQAFVKQFEGPRVNQRIRIDSRSKAAGIETPNTVYIDGITRATVSAIVINDTILSASLKVARQMLDEFAQAAATEVNKDHYEEYSWAELVSKGLIKRWVLTREEIEQAAGGRLQEFADSSIDPNAELVEIFYAYLNTPTTGKNILGENLFATLHDGFSLKPNEHAVLIASKGLISYIEEDFRPGSIPDRIGLNQNGLSIPLRDVNFAHMAELGYLSEDPINLTNTRIFKIKPQTGFNPGAAMQMSLNISLRKNHLEKRDVVFADTYKLPDALFTKTKDLEVKPRPLWVTIWLDRAVQIGILLSALVLLTLVFIKQRWVAGLADNFEPFRWSFLLFTLIFIGYYTQGQLSVVNIFTILIALVTEFKIEVFLLDPIIFILWVYTFASLFLIGRGVFCGWLCPFGVLQEIVAWIAAKLSIRQWKISAQTHTKLTKVKYLILIVLIGLSFYSLGLAESLSEVEPFKTAITMNFVRAWPFVMYSLVLLALGLFINKFYCRYVCPLGAGLAILGRFRKFDNLERRSECGKPCQTCRHACGVSAINKLGEIDYNECIQCLECVVILQDENRCSPLVVRNKQKEKQLREIPILHSTAQPPKG